MAGYGDDEGLTAWLSSSGYSLPDGSPSSAVLRQRGSDFLDALYGSRFSGEPTGGIAQERAWPRTGAYAWGEPIASDAVPATVVKAAYHAAYLQALSPAGTSSILSNPARVKRDKVGDTETEFFAGTDSDAPVTVFDGVLAPFLDTAKALLGIRAIG